MASEPEEIVREVRIAARPDEVFPYFTDADKLVVWKAARAELDARPGGVFRMDVTGRGDIARGQYVEIDPPRRVVFTWEWEDRGAATPPPRSMVEVTLSPDGDGTLLRLVHRGVPQESRRGSAAGWAHYLARLALAAAGHDPGPDPWATAEPGGPMFETEIETRGSSDGRGTQQGHPAAPLRTGHERARRRRGRRADHP